MIEVNEFKKGLCIVYKDGPYLIVDVSFSTPTARGGNTIAKTKLRHVETGQLISESIRTGGKYEVVDIEQRPISYLYSDGTRWHFMDAESFEQFDLGADDLGEGVGFLIDGIQGLRAISVRGKIVDVVLPHTVDLLVTEADPHVAGGSARAQMKWAKVETGVEVQVPSYVEAGDKIRIDTRDGHFVERAK